MNKEELYDFNYFNLIKQFSKYILLNKKNY